MSPASTPPLVTVDVVLLTLKGGVLMTALTLRDQEPFAHQWALPGGWVHPQEDSDEVDAAMRILKAKTGLESPYLEQLRTFCGSHRDPRGWSVSIAHYALVPEASVSHVANDHLRWVAADGLRALPFDHLQILHTALSRVRSKTLYSSLPVHLMPARFTLGELQQVYEGLLGSALDKRTFRRRIEELDVVEEVPGLLTQGRNGRAAQQFQRKPRTALTLAMADSNLGVRV